MEKIETSRKTSPSFLPAKMLELFVMVCQTPARLRLGPLTVYVASSDGCPDLASLVASLPSDQPVIWLDSARTHPVTGRWSMLAYDRGWCARRAAIAWKYARVMRRRPCARIRLRRFGTSCGSTPSLGRLELVWVLRPEPWDSWASSVTS